MDHIKLQYAAYAHVFSHVKKPATEEPEFISAINASGRVCLDLGKATF